jgi:hypothetical protein
MKKLVCIFIGIFLLIIGAIYFMRQDAPLIDIMPKNTIKPLTFSSCAEPLLIDTLHQKGYKTRWTSPKKLPKKHQYFKQLLYFLSGKPKAKKIVFHNFLESYSKEQVKFFPAEKKILILWEPPSVLLEQYQPQILDHFGVVLTWNDDLVDGKKFFKFNYPELQPMQEHIPSFEERQFLCMIASNLEETSYPGELYSLRRKAIRFFETSPPGTFDLYGKGWDVCLNAKGRIKDKFDTLKQYKFQICFENCHISGYITEKIFDCFAVGTIPIYFGASNIEDYIPTNCFIDFRQFHDFKEMLDFIQTVSKEEYEEYLENIRHFLQSEKSTPFTKKAFVETVLKAIESFSKNPSNRYN